jgi:nucleotide-binding universal stress UspA family protein
LTASKTNNARAILLGYPFQRTEQNFKKIIEEISSETECPITIVRFTGILHTERILVPIVNSSDLEVVADTLCGLAKVGKHSITLVRLLPADAQNQEIAASEKRLYSWAAGKGLPFVNCIVTKTEARLETIVKEAQTHDLLVMAVLEGAGIKKMFLGSLADDVAGVCQRPMLMVHRSRQ